MFKNNVWKKKLAAIGEEKDCERLIQRIKSIVNHLYWVPILHQRVLHQRAKMNCGGGKWISVFHHIQNIYEGQGEHYQRCELDQFDEAARQSIPGKVTAIISPIMKGIPCIFLSTQLHSVMSYIFPFIGTKVVEKLEPILTSRQMKKDIPMLAPDLQTSSLEAFHSVINHYAPKLNKFSFHGMQSR
jgi:hypothetical protein